MREKIPRRRKPAGQGDREKTSLSVISRERVSLSQKERAASLFNWDVIPTSEVTSLEHLLRNEDETSRAVLSIVHSGGGGCPYTPPE